MGRRKTAPHGGIPVATSGIKKRISSGTKTAELVFSVLKKLEECEMDKYKCASELGISTMTVYRYFNDHWYDYEKKKELDKLEHERMDKAYALVETAQTPVITPENHVEVLTAVVSIRERLKDSFYYAIEEFDRRVKDPVERRRMASKELVQHITNVVPYLLAKEAMRATNDDANDKADDFMANFVELMSKFKTKDK